MGVINVKADLTDMKKVSPIPDFLQRAPEPERELDYATATLPGAFSLKTISK